MIDMFEIIVMTIFITGILAVPLISMVESFIHVVDLIVSGVSVSSVYFLIKRCGENIILGEGSALNIVKGIFTLDVIILMGVLAFSFIYILCRYKIEENRM